MAHHAAVLEADVPVSTRDRSGKYLIFRLGKEEFGVGVLKVREIMGVQDITKVPHTPEYVRGVINLRGKVTPVVDLRARFGLPGKEYDQQTCIIVLQVKMESREVPMGIIVDAVSEVLTISEGDVENTPEFGEGIEVPYITGIAKVKGSVKMLLDIDQVLTRQELYKLDALGFTEQTA